jgi:hypothetical protein
VILSAIAPYAKAVLASVLAGLGAAKLALVPDENGVSQITGSEWLDISYAVIASLVLVFAIPNKDPKAKHQDESVQPPANGAAAGVVDEQDVGRIAAAMRETRPIYGDVIVTGGAHRREAEESDVAEPEAEFGMVGVP